MNMQPTTKDMATYSHLHILNAARNSFQSMAFTQNHTRTTATAAQKMYWMIFFTLLSIGLTKVMENP